MVCLWLTFWLSPTNLCWVGRSQDNALWVCHVSFLALRPFSFPGPALLPLPFALRLPVYKEGCVCNFTLSLSLSLCLHYNLHVRIWIVSIILCTKHMNLPHVFLWLFLLVVLKGIRIPSKCHLNPISLLLIIIGLPNTEFERDWYIHTL